MLSALSDMSLIRSHQPQENAHPAAIASALWRLSHRARSVLVVRQLTAPVGLVQLAITASATVLAHPAAIASALWHLSHRVRAAPAAWSLIAVPQLVQLVMCPVRSRQRLASAHRALLPTAV